MSDESQEESYGSWGPRHTPFVIGHEAAERTLLEAWGSGKLPHAWLITGPRGVGKMTMALRFARFLLAHGTAPDAEAGGGLFGPAPLPQNLDVAAESEDAALLRNNAHPDCHILEMEPGKKVIVVGDDKDGGEAPRNSARGLKHFFTMTLSRAKARVAIVDSADDLNPNAANALLKILEEPPPRTVLLLISHAPGGLLPTIRSRCRRLPLPPLSPDRMAEALARLMPEVPEADRRSLALLAEGAPGRAMALGAEGGLELLRDLLDLVAGLPRPDWVKVHAYGDRFARRGRDDAFRAMGALFRWWLARLVRAAAAGPAAAARGQGELYAGEAALMARMTTWQAPDRWAEDWEAIGRLLDRGESVNLEPKQMLLNLFAILGRAAEAGARA